MVDVRVLYVEDDLLLRGLVVRCINERIAELRPEIALWWELAATLPEAMLKLELRNGFKGSAGRREVNGTSHYANFGTLAARLELRSDLGMSVVPMT